MPPVAWITLLMVLLGLVSVRVLTIPAYPWLPSVDSGRDFLGELWSVHATLVGVSVVAVTVIVTGYAGRRPQERVWRLYVTTSFFRETVALSFAAIAYEGVARLALCESERPVLAGLPLTNLALPIVILFLLSLGLTVRLWVKTAEFLQPGRVHELGETQILRMIGPEVRSEMAGRLHSRRGVKHEK